MIVVKCPITNRTLKSATVGVAMMIKQKQIDELITQLSKPAQGIIKK
jgi:hypothetical protein